MATSRQDGWYCKRSECNAFNREDDYRCRRCDRSTKPYDPTRSIELRTPDWSPPDSPTASQETSFAFPPVTSPGTTYMSTQKVTWPHQATGGARSKYTYVYYEGIRAAASNVGHQQDIAFPDGECRVLLMGKTGNGKSSTGNTILNLDEKDPGSFASSASLQSVTKKCQCRQGVRFGIKLEVVDTPGFFDTDEEMEVIKKELSCAVGIASKGPHAILLVARCDSRFTKEEVDSVANVRELFGEKIMKHVIVVFTRGDSLQANAEPDAFLNNMPGQLKNILQDAGNRYIVFNNKGSPEEKGAQVRELLQRVCDMMRSSGQSAFTTPFLSQCDEIVEKGAEEVATLLDSGTVKPEHRDVIRAGLESLETKDETSCADTPATGKKVKVLQDILKPMADWRKKLKIEKGKTMDDFALHEEQIAREIERIITDSQNKLWRACDEKVELMMENAKLKTRLTQLESRANTKTGKCIIL